MSHGWLSGRGSSSARPLPAHSIVAATSTAGQRAELVEPEAQRALDRAADLEPPARRVDERHVVVDEEVVETRRRDRPSQRLERHRVVPRREAQLVDGDPRIGRERHRSGAELGAHELVDDPRVGLALRLLHHLTDEEAEQPVLAAAVRLDLRRVRRR